MLDQGKRNNLLERKELEPRNSALCNVLHYNLYTNVNNIYEDADKRLKPSTLCDWTDECLKIIVTTYYMCSAVLSREAKEKAKTWSSPQRAANRSKEW